MSPAHPFYGSVIYRNDAPLSKESRGFDSLRDRHSFWVITLKGSARNFSSFGSEFDSHMTYQIPARCGVLGEPAPDSQ